jgi:hypothetical protein
LKIAKRLGQRRITASAKPGYHWGKFPKIHSTDPRMQGPIRTVELTAHQSLLIAGQALVADWRLQARVKFLFLLMTITSILLASYHLLVRHKPLGRLLNGPPRKEKVSSSIAA